MCLPVCCAGQAHEINLLLATYGEPAQEEGEDTGLRDAGDLVESVEDVLNRIETSPD